MGNKDKDKEHSEAEAIGEGAESVTAKEVQMPTRPAGTSAMKGKLT